MKKQKFKVKIFTATIDVLEKSIEIKLGKELRTFPFDDFDEWNCVKFGGKEYDVHIYYEEELTVSIYDVENGNTNVHEWHKVKLSAKVGSKTIKLQ